MTYEVKVDAFSGPLDLLLHLIHRLEIDIYDIPMAEITSQYMEHIHAMKELELNEASEYLVMAATLLAIKSRMLLPIHEGELEDEEFELDAPDPREELVARLIEYKKFKDAAQNLQQLEEERARSFTRPPTDLSHLMPTEQLQLFDTNINVYDMLGAFQKMMRRKQLRSPLKTTVKRAEFSIKAQMKSVVSALQQAKGRTMFSELFPYDDKSALVVTFLSILELMKRQMIAVEQHHNFDDLAVVLLKEEFELHDDTE